MWHSTIAALGNKYTTSGNCLILSGSSVYLTFSPTKCVPVFHLWATSFLSSFPNTHSCHLPVPSCPLPRLYLRPSCPPRSSIDGSLPSRLPQVFPKCICLSSGLLGHNRLNLYLVPISEGDPKKQKVGECRKRRFWCQSSALEVMLGNVIPSKQGAVSSDPGPETSQQYFKSRGGLSSFPQFKVFRSESSTAGSTSEPSISVWHFPGGFGQKDRLLSG